MVVPVPGRPARLIAFSGLPGTGKTTVARALCQATGATYLRIDSIESALRRAGAVTAEGGVGPGGYIAAHQLAEDNLMLGHTVVLDAVYAHALTRETVREVACRAGAALYEVELVCSDAKAHRGRIESRHATMPGQTLPSWQEVLDRTYDAWDREHRVIDTSVLSVRQAVDASLAGFADIRGEAIPRDAIGVASDASRS